MVKDADGKCFSAFGPSRGAPGRGSFTHCSASPSAHSPTTVHSTRGPDGHLARPGGALVKKNDLVPTPGSLCSSGADRYVRSKTLTT